MRPALFLADWLPSAPPRLSRAPQARQRARAARARQGSPAAPGMIRAVQCCNVNPPHCMQRERESVERYATVVHSTGIQSSGREHETFTRAVPWSFFWHPL